MTEQWTNAALLGYESLTLATSGHSTDRQ
jgi:hypothetical protein